MANQPKVDDCIIELHTEEDGSDNISREAVLCHCCYDIMVDPTTLNCGHSFCRHCLALWVQTSQKMECPGCCEIFQQFPKINILLRDLVETHFPANVKKRRKDILDDPRVVLSLQAFQTPAHNGSSRGGLLPARWHPRMGMDCFFRPILIAITFVTVVFLMYHWSGGNSEVELLVKKPLTAWTVKEVAMWMENLGPWTAPYRDVFLKEQVNGRLLNALGEEDLSKPPYSIGNQLHRRAMQKEVLALQTLGSKRPQTLWEYKVVNEKKSFFLLFGLIHSPRFTILYMFLFDYHDSFLPFIHISCPSQSKTRSGDDDLFFRNLQQTPSTKQWLHFLLELCFLPYQLLADFAWDWLDVHYWTSFITIISAFLLTLQEGFMIRVHWRTTNIRKVPAMVLCHTLGMAYMGFGGILLWQLLPQFVCDCLFYWALYCNPVINTCNLIRILFPHIYH
ncbi:bifunctional apoptosis regulator-like [Brachyhypopomus gauderio]|uniref:bifunctional apoptosis regulator-like n=1 Tax=Brachyhypopomus gauderio TaxID=698409 RepID=UPI00404203A6